MELLTDQTWWPSGDLQLLPGHRLQCTQRLLRHSHRFTWTQVQHKASGLVITNTTIWYTCTISVVLRQRKTNLDNQTAISGCRIFTTMLKPCLRSPGWHLIRGDQIIRVSKRYKKIDGHLTWPAMLQIIGSQIFIILVFIVISALTLVDNPYKGRCRQLSFNTPT